jgi:hypothetical protein
MGHPQTRQQSSTGAIEFMGQQWVGVLLWNDSQTNRKAPLNEAQHRPLWGSESRNKPYYSKSLGGSGMGRIQSGWGHGLTRPPGTAESTGPPAGCCKTPHPAFPGARAPRTAPKTRACDPSKGAHPLRATPTQAFLQQPARHDQRAMPPIRLATRGNPDSIRICAPSYSRDVQPPPILMSHCIRRETARLPASGGDENRG